MSNQDEVVKDILISAIESKHIPRHSGSYENDGLDKNLENITKAYKEIYKAVNQPMD